jgi:hypothetical protein
MYQTSIPAPTRAGIFFTQPALSALGTGRRYRRSLALAGYGTHSLRDVRNTEVGQPLAGFPNPSRRLSSLGLLAVPRSLPARKAGPSLAHSE